LRTVDAVRVRGDRQVHERGIQALQVRGDVEAQPVAHDLDERTGRPDRADEHREGLVLGDPGGLAPEQRRIAGQDLHVPAGQVAGADQAVLVGAFHGPNQALVRAMALQQEAADVLARDRAVVVDEDADRSTHGRQAGNVGCAGHRRRG
jgi:hypothetical protein